MVLDDEFFTVTFMREGTIPPNWKYLIQHVSQSGALDNIDLNGTWFNPDLDEDPRKPPNHEQSIAPENNNKTLVFPQPKTHVTEGAARREEPVSELIEHLYPEGVQNT